MSILKKEKIYIQFVPKTGGIHDKLGHPASQGMDENAIFSLPPLTNIDGSYKKILSDDEINELQEYLEADISFKNKEFWSNVRVGLKKAGLHLDLSVPMDYIYYSILRSWANPKFYDVAKSPICASPDKLKEGKTFKYVIVKPDEVAKAKRAGFDRKKSAYMLIGKLESNKDILKYLYFATTPDKRIATDTQGADFLLGHFDNLIETNPGLFVLKAEDKLLEIKALLFNAWCEGVLDVKNKEFFFEGKPLAAKDNQATLENAAAYINHHTKQELKFRIEALLDEKRNK